jgi:hypothetical protein
MHDSQQVEPVVMVEAESAYHRFAEQVVESIGSNMHERGITGEQDRFPGCDDKNY